MAPPALLRTISGRLAGVRALLLLIVLGLWTVWIVGSIGLAVFLVVAVVRRYGDRPRTVTPGSASTLRGLAWVALVAAAISAACSAALFAFIAAQGDYEVCGQTAGPCTMSTANGVRLPLLEVGPPVAFTPLATAAGIVLMRQASAAEHMTLHHDV